MVTSVNLRTIQELSSATMSNNLDHDRSVAGKMHPIDLATQKITIVKSVSNSEVKMAHLVPGQTKTTGPSQIIPHASPGGGLMRPGLAQIISSNVASQVSVYVTSTHFLNISKQCINKKTILKNLK